MDNIIYIAPLLFLIPIGKAIAFRIVAKTNAQYPDQNNLAILKTIYKPKEKDQIEIKLLK